MASFIGENVSSPVYAMRDKFDLPTKINEGKALGSQGYKTDIIQKLALALPSEDRISALRQKSSERVTAKDNKPDLMAQRPAAPPKKETVAPTVKFENAYRDTKGFAAVA